MSEELITIRVNIADRFYPLTIKRNEEENVRKAAKRINDTILQFKKKYNEKDSQDFLAMSSLQFVSKLIENEEKQNISSFVEKIREVDKELEEYFIKEQNVL